MPTPSCPRRMRHASCCATPRVPAVTVARAISGLSSEGLVERSTSSSRMAVIAAHPAGRQPRRAEFAKADDLDAGMICRLSSISTPISTRATSGRASANPDGTWLGALDAGARRPRGQLGGGRCRAAHGFLAALRLCARHRRDPHPSRFAPPQHRITLEVFAEVRERWADRIELQAVALVPARCHGRGRLLRRSRHGRSAMPAACSAASRG